MCKRVVINNQTSFIYCEEYKRVRDTRDLWLERLQEAKENLARYEREYRRIQEEHQNAHYKTF